MAGLLTPSTLEDHATGTLAKNAIIRGNWAKLNAMLDPDLDSTDPTYAAQYGILEAAINGQRGITTKSYLATVQVSMKGKRMQKLVLAGNVIIDVDNKKAGREVVLHIHGDGSSRTVTWDAAHKWASPAITTIAANKVARITIACEDGTSAGVILSGTVGT